jgi:branched-chain amino acid transport system substrate-binding protein
MKYPFSLLFSLFIFTSQVFAENKEAGGQQEEFDLGVLLCLTTACSEWGTNSLNAINLAVNELNSKGGILGKKIKLSIQDTAEGPGGASTVTAYKNLILNKNIHYIIGPTWTSGGMPLAPLAAKEKEIIITSPSLGVADFNEAGEHMFNTWPHDSYSSEALAQYAFDKGWKKVAIFGSQQPWETAQAEAFEKKFKELGGTITASVYPMYTATDLKTEAFKLKRSNPEAVFFSNYNQLGMATKELKKTGYNGPQLAILMDKTRIEEAQGALEETVFARYPEPDQKFKNNYRAVYKEDPGISADTAYDTVMVYAEAITKAGTFDVQKVIPVLQTTKMQGASGEIVFDKFGGVIKSPVFYVVRKNAMIPLQ